MATTNNGEWVETKLALGLAICASVLALALSSRNMLLHARHYNFPRTQKYIFRILFVVPVYAICSGIAIIATTGKVVVVALTVRDCYEAFVVYSFLTLILEHAGGDYNCIEQIKHLPPVNHPWPFCCLAPVRRDGTLLRLSKQATLQFVVVKPTMAILSLIALAAGQYFADSFQATLLVVYNVSYSVALYGLLMFYKAIKSLITPFRPVRKFIAVKGVVFATYWQSVIVHFIPGLTSEQALLWNDWLLCMELVAMAVMLNLAFPWHDFIMERQDKPVFENVREMLSVRDVFQDAYHSFMPSYQDYVVARDDHDPNRAASSRGDAASRAGGDSGQIGEKKSRVVRMRTFLVGNLDRGSMNGSSSSMVGGSSGSAYASGGKLGGGGEGRGRSRGSRDEDMEGGLDEDWGQDVDIIELQSNVFDSNQSGKHSRSAKDSGVGGAELDTTPRSTPSSGKENMRT